jgi:Ran GTPase-activating protein (RanGAP) involved in mRNA processing and transport
VLKKCKNSNGCKNHSDQGAAEFFASLANISNLSELYFRETYIGMQGCTALATLLNNPSSHIQVLDLNDTEIVNDGDDAHIKILGNAFIGHNTLHTLKLRRACSMSGATVNIFRAVLSHPRSLLETLDISFTGIDDEGSICLGNALAINTSLRHLQISGNEAITSVGWEGLSMCLRSSISALEFLTAMNCNIDDEGFVAIFLALAGNSSLKGLNTLKNRSEI